MIQGLSTQIAAAPPNYSYWIGPAATFAGPALGGILTLSLGWFLYTMKRSDDKFVALERLLAELCDQIAKLKALDTHLYARINFDMDRNEVYLHSYELIQCLHNASSTAEKCMSVIDNRDWIELHHGIRKRFELMYISLYNDVISPGLDRDRVLSHQLKMEDLVERNSGDVYRLIGLIHSLKLKKKLSYRIKIIYKRIKSETQVDS